MECWIYAQRVLFCPDPFSQSGCLSNTLVPSGRWTFLIYSAFLAVPRKTTDTYATPSSLEVEVSVKFKFCFIHENSLSLVGYVNK